MSHEFDLIAAIRSRVKPHPGVALGIGDDTAVLRVAGGESLVTTDMLLEGVHFLVDTTPPEAIGRKALAVNLSDLAAMAGIPTAAFVSLALPRRYGRDFADRCLAGLAALADEFSVSLAGGDTNIWDGPCVINVAVCGEPGPWGPVLRSGARPDDVLLVSGSLGGSLSGRHLSFIPRIELAWELARRAPLHAMIDLSDGLSSDLPHILEESHVGAEIDLARIPIHDDVDSALPWEERLAHALNDGEDFELLACLPPVEAEQLVSNWSGDPPWTVVGRITGTPGCRGILHGQSRPWTSAGWEHRWS